MQIGDFVRVVGPGLHENDLFVGCVGRVTDRRHDPTNQWYVEFVPGAYQTVHIFWPGTGTTAWDRFPSANLLPLAPAEAEFQRVLWVLEG